MVTKLETPQVLLHQLMTKSGIKLLVILQLNISLFPLLNQNLKDGNILVTVDHVCQLKETS